MLATMLALIFQIMKHGIDRLALLADRVDHVLALGHAVAEVDKIDEVASIGKAILHEAFDDAMTHLNKLFIIVCFTPLHFVEGIQQHTATET